MHTLMAGRDTTGSLLGWVFYFLARHPRVYEKLRGIVLEEFGKEGVERKVNFTSQWSAKVLISKNVSCYEREKKKPQEKGKRTKGA